MNPSVFDESAFLFCTPLNGENAWWRYLLDTQAGRYTQFSPPATHPSPLSVVISNTDTYFAIASHEGFALGKQEANISIGAPIYRMF